MKPTDLLLVLLANTVWAFNFIAGKAGVAHFPPLLFTTLRFGLLLVLLLPFIRWVPGQMKQVLRISFILGVLHFSLIFTGLAAAADVSSIAIVSQLYVPFAALLAVVFLGETMSRQRWSGISLACAGVMVIGFDPIVFRHLDALALIIAAALAMAVATILMRQLQGVGVFTLQAWIALLATPSMLALSLLLEHGQWTALRSAGWMDLGAPAYSAIGASLIGHGIVYHLLGRYPVNVLTPLLLLTPLLAILFGVTLWGDMLTWKLLLGGAMTLTGVILVNVLEPKMVPDAKGTDLGVLEKI